MIFNYRILDFEQVNKELDRLIKGDTDTIIPVVKQEKLCTTRLGYSVERFSIGNGNKHIVIIGATHGSEIISCDFVLRLMESVSKKINGFEDFDENEVTLDFIPLHNPEGYIISTSAVRTIIKDSMSNEEKQKVCKKYWEIYKEDDINSKNNPDDHTTPKLHQLMFKDAIYTCISDKHSVLRESLKNIQQKYNHPIGSMICWRSNGSGIELNRNVPFNNDSSVIEYGYMRYNNILKNVPGPIGRYCYGQTFSFEPENLGLFELIDSLYKTHKYCGILTYHSTYGMLFANPSYKADESILTDEDRYIITTINQHLAQIYSKTTDYGIIDDPDFESTDELLRILYPGTILVELSKMGGNPIGPYGDIANYQRVMNDNLYATSEVIKELGYMQPFLYKEKILVTEGFKK